MLRVPRPAGPGQRQRHRADRAAARPRRAVRRARADRGARARAARSPPPATGLTPPPRATGPSRPQPAPAVVVSAADPGTALTPAGHRAAGELHRGNDADGLVRWAGGRPRRYRAAALGPAAQVRTGLPGNTASRPIPPAAS